jgi:hypothetical protein
MEYPEVKISTQNKTKTSFDEKRQHLISCPIKTFIFVKYEKDGEKEILFLFVEQELFFFFE